MTAVTQKIPNFIGGISQQPNELQPLGTVKDALNVIPDVKGVVAKRPGSRFVRALTDNPDGKWYHYYRDENEQYVMLIKRDGVVQVWDKEGRPKPVTFNDTPGNAITNGLPVPGEPDGTPQYPNCNLTDYNNTYGDLQIAEKNLQDKKEEIEAAGVRKQRLEAEVEGTFSYDLLYKTLKVGQAQLSDGTVFLEQGEPEAQTGFTTTTVYRETADIVVRSTTNNAVGYVDKLYPNARLYAWKTVRDAAQTELDAVIQEIEDLTAEIPALVVALSTARSAWSTEAENCGIYENPFGLYRDVRETPDNVPEYLRHEKDEDLQLMTVNDYTFVTNRTKIPLLNSGSYQYDSNYQSYVSLDLLAIDKPYTLFFDQIDESQGTPTTFTRATAIRISPGNFEDGNDSCDKAGSQQVTATGSGGKTMSVIITAIGTQFYVGPDPDTGGSNYDCRYQVTATLVSSGSGWAVGDTASASMNGKGYTITVTEVSSQETSADIIVDVPAITSTLDSNALLGNFVTAIENATDYEARIVGSGVFIEDPNKNKPFKVSTPDGAYLTCINNQVNNAGDLPDQCVDGYVVKVVNSFIDEDDYWVKFKTELDSTDSTGDLVPAGAGVWEETYDPSVDTTFDYTTMPYQIRRMSNQTFEVSPIAWGQRDVGDEVTNPTPSFVGQPINKMVFFRNRFAMLSGESIIFSRPNEYFNFWARTALAVSDSDPIDLNVSSTFPAILYDAIDTAAGLLLFSENQQHVVVTDNTDVFAPETAVVKSVGTYQFNIKTEPIDMGQTIGFLNDAGYRSRYFEMVPSKDDRYQAVEISKPVDQLIPSGVNLVATSKDNAFLAFGVKDTEEIFVYRYFTDGDTRKQSAWIRWQLHGKLKYHFVIGDKYYIVTESPAGDGAITNLQEINLVIDEGQTLINIEGPTMRSYDYQIHLDGYYMVIPSEMSYDSATNKTTFRLPIGYHGSNKCVAYEILLSEEHTTSYVQSGRTAEVTLSGTVDNVQASIEGDWTRQNLVTGFPFDMQLQLPTLYVSKTASTGYTTKDTRAYLTIHRVQLDFESLGEIQVLVQRRGREDYTYKFYSTPADFYQAGSTAVERNQQRILPIYDKNENVEIKIHADSPEPVALISASWEGDYSNRNYRNV